MIAGRKPIVLSLLLHSLILVFGAGWLFHPASVVQPAGPGEVGAGWSLLDEVAAQLQAQLGIETYSAAWARGQTLDLNTETAKQLAEL